MHTRDGFRPQRAACPSIIQVKISAVLLQNIFNFFQSSRGAGRLPRAHCVAADKPALGLVIIPERICVKGVAFLADVSGDFLDGGF